MKKRSQAVIVGAARTPVGKFGGMLAHLSAEDLGVYAVTEAIKRSGIDLATTKIDEVIGGMVYFVNNSQRIFLPRNVATRVAKNFNDGDNLAKAPGLIEQRICGTGFQVIATAANMIEGNSNGKANCVIAFGTESMSNVPQKYLMEGFQHKLFDTNMAATAELYGKQLGITREECDEFAALSHERAAYAQSHTWFQLFLNGYLGGIFGIDLKDENGDYIIGHGDEGVRDYASNEEAIEKLSALKPLDLPGIEELVTPGTCSQISDGAAAMVLMDRNYADKLGLKYEFEIAGFHVATVDPRIMGQGPVPAIRGLIEKIGVKKLDDIDLFEVNEAFAPQYLAVEKELGLPRERTNVNGGAIAIGHPLGNTGARIMTDLMYELKRREEDTGIGSACIGGGQGIAVYIKKVD